MDYNYGTQSSILMVFFPDLFVQILQTIVSRAQDATRTSRSLSTKEVMTFYYSKVLSSICTLHTRSL